MARLVYKIVFVYLANQDKVLYKTSELVTFSSLFLSSVILFTNMVSYFVIHNHFFTIWLRMLSEFIYLSCKFWKLWYSNNMKKILILLALVTILFISSGQTYEQQSLISTLQNMFPDKPFESLLALLKIPYWGHTISVEERGYYQFVEFLLRKAAHFFLFGFVALAFYAVLPKWRGRWFIALVWTFILATVDEYHQSVTGGRTPSGQDVFLDMCGAVVFLSALVFMKRIFGRRSE